MVLLRIVCSTIWPLRHFKACQSVHLTRTYARWVSRRPIAIVNEDELFECEDTTKQSKVPQVPKIERRPRKRAKSSVKPEETKPKEKKNIFTKVKENEKIVMSLMTKLRSRKKREKSGEIILEGHRLIKDALDAGLVPTTILFSNSDDIKSLTFPDNVELYKIPYKTIQLWSSLTTSPGLLGVFQTPDVENNPVASNVLPLTIICDNVRDPGNLGSIMRAAAGVGCEKLILMKGCVDLWDPKVLRSAAGTHFRLPIHSFPTWDEVPSLIGEDCHVFVADSNFGDEYVSNYSPDVLKFSLEIFDIDPEELKSKFTLPEGNAESELPRNKDMMRECLLRIPIVPYYSIDYTRKETVLVVSGETEGLSYDSYKFILNEKGIRVNIPLMQGVESLNAGVALGVVSFEIRRQFLKKNATLR